MCSLKRLGWMMTLLLMSLSVIGCAVPARVGVEYCDHARPVYFDSREQVQATPPPIRRQVLEGNKEWKALCDYSPTELSRSR